MKRSSVLRIVVIAVAGMFAGLACNTFDPELGNIPFQCGADEPRCPLGYTCVVYSDGALCEKTADESEPDGGAASFECSDDTAFEPNNGIEAATNTLIPSMGSNYRLAEVSICPDGDEDYFTFEVDVSGKNLRADVTHLSNRGTLLVDVLNAAGSSIRSGNLMPGSPVPGSADVVRVEVANLPQGTYYVQVRAPAGIQNNYTIEIDLTE